MNIFQGMWFLILRDLCFKLFATCKHLFMVILSHMVLLLNIIFLHSIMSIIQIIHDGVEILKENAGGMPICAEFLLENQSGQRSSLLKSLPKHLTFRLNLGVQ